MDYQLKLSEIIYILTHLLSIIHAKVEYSPSNIDNTAIIAVELEYAVTSIIEKLTGGTQLNTNIIIDNEYDYDYIRTLKLRLIKYSHIFTTPILGFLFDTFKESTKEVR